jgi:hypothetical protein
MTVFPLLTSCLITASNLSISWKCNPVVGSSSIYTVFSLTTFESSFASFILCDSPPDRVVADCPSFMYPKPTSLRSSSFLFIGLKVMEKF